MEIDINQQKIAVGDKYKIFIGGQQTHFASRQIFSLLPVVNLYELNNDRPRMTKNKLFSFFKAKYDITRWDNMNVRSGPIAILFTPTEAENIPFTKTISRSPGGIRIRSAHFVLPDR